MSIDKPGENFTTPVDTAECLRSQLFQPGDKMLFNVSEVNPRELLENNEKLVAAVQMQADRLATAACRTLAGVPEHLQKDFFNGISCYTSEHDVVYNAIRAQWQA